jgi:hypothetical protein
MVARHTLVPDIGSQRLCPANAQEEQFDGLLLIKGIGPDRRINRGETRISGEVTIICPRLRGRR